MANTETNIDVEVEVKGNEIEIEVEMNTQQVEESTKDVKKALSDIEKSASSVSESIKKALNTLANGVSSAFDDVGTMVAEAFTVTNLEEYQAAAEQFGEALAGALFTMDENIGMLETSIVDTVAPLASVAVPIINEATLAVTDLVNGVGQVIGALFNGSEATEALAQSAEAVGRIEMQTGTVNDTLSPQLQAVVDKIMSLVTPLQTIDISPIVSAFAGFQTVLTPLTQELFAGLEWAYLNIFTPLATWTTEGLLPGFLDLLSGVMSTLNAALAALQPLAIWFWDSFLQPIAEWTGGLFVESLQWLAENLGLLGTWILEHQPIIEAIAIVVGSVGAAIGIVNAGMAIWNAIGVVGTAVTTAFGTAMSFLTSPIGIVIVAITAIIAIIVLLVKNWDTVSAKAQEVWTFVQNKFAEFGAFLENVFARDWTEQFGVFGNVLNAFFANVQNIWNSVKTIFNGIVSFVKSVFAGDWEAAWDSVKQIFSGIWQGLMAAVKGPINGVIGFINGMVSGIVRGVNSVISVLNGLKFTIPDWVPGFGGKTFGFNIRTISAPSIPYLAQGAVLPANKPFLAMVGDQRHGTNVEAPLATIQEAVALVMNDQIGAMMAGFQALLEEQRATRLAVESIRVGDETIAAAVDRHQIRMAMMRGY